ncbi:MAG: hypothetical protein ACOCZW_01305 [Bacteroidota bacterium]
MQQYPTEFIGSKINYELAKKIHDVNAVCAFSGISINQGVKVSDITGATFTDYAYIKYPSGYVSVNAAKCLSEFKIEGKKWALRSNSFLCTDEELKTLKLPDVYDIITDPPSGNWVLGYSFNNKKHISFKARINNSRDKFFVSTDTLGNIQLERDLLNILLPILQDWYTYNPDLHAKNQTYFNKSEILHGSNNMHKIKEYGFDRFQTENNIIKKYRNTSFLELLVRVLNVKDKA